MKTLSFKNLPAKRNLTTFAAIGFIFCATSLQSSFAQSELTIDTSAIDAREQELRRKEQELLQNLDLNTTHISDEKTSSSASSKPVKAVSEETNAVTVLEINAPQPKAAEDIKPENADVVSVSKPAPLKEIEQHPALAPKAVPTPAPFVTRNRVRTYSNDNYPDGTTARRVGSFYRLDNSDNRRGNGSRASKAHTVSIDQISREPKVRPALLTSDESATISNANTFLKTGPARSDSSLLKVPRDSGVKIDYRTGSWYRVKTEAGVRGWVPGTSLVFDTDVPAGSTVRVGGIKDTKR